MKKETEKTRTMWSGRSQRVKGKGGIRELE